MHDPGAYVEVSTLFPFLVIFILASFGIVNLVKLTAGRFLNTLRLEGIAAEDRLGKKKESASMIEGHGVCDVCGRVSTKRCSQCKAVRYCSLNCQREHWNQGHKKECRPAKAPDPVDLKKNASGMLQSNASLAKNPTNGTLLGAATGISDGIPSKPKKVLFPYDEFIKLFNWDKLRLPPCGLLNCGNSCFANVVLQCLTYTRPLVAYLLEANHMHTCTRNDRCFLCELQHHVERVSRSENPFSPTGILSRIPNIGGNLGYGRQEDAHEFMRFAIDSMQSICLDEFGGEKVVDPHTQETTLIQHIFGGQLRSQVKCTQCHRVSNRYENMMDLTVEIHGDVASLEDALEQFTACEWLDGENKYKCDGCNAYVKARKQLTVYQAPNVLTVALKRFQTGRFGKLNKRVTFPETLDLSSYVSGREDGLHIYKLYAVVVHVDMLNASFFGHYICYIKDLHGMWYKIDDCKVKEVELEEVLSQRAYMLLYSRISVRPPPVAAGISAPEVIEGEKSNNFNSSTPHCQNPSYFASYKTDGSLPGPFEVVEPLRDNLGGAQESSADESVRHSLSTRVAPGSSHNVMGSLHIEDTELLSVEMMSEEPGSLTSNSSCSEGLSIKNVKMSLDSPISLDPKLLATGGVPARKHRGASCPPTMVGGRLGFGIPTPSSSVRGITHSASLNNLYNGSNAAVLGMGSLMKNGLGDNKSNILASEGPYLDTPRTSDLTEAGNSRVLDFQSCDSDMVGPEKMDCDSQIIHPSTENSCDGLLTSPEEPACDEIVDSFLQHMPSSINTSFSDENAEILPHPSSGMGQLLNENQYDIVPGHGDRYDHSGKTSDLIDADMIDNGKCDPEHKLHLMKDTSVEMNFTEETLGVDSLPGMPHSRAHLSHAYAAELIESDQKQEKISSTPERGISGIYSESVRLNREFPNEDGVAEEVADSTLHQVVSASDLLFEHSKKDTGIDKVDQDSLPRNRGIDTRDASASFSEFSANSGNGANIISSDSSQLDEPICTPVKRTLKSKPILVPGFLKKASRIQTVADSRPSQDRDIHADAPNGIGSAHEKSCSPFDATGLETADFVQFDANSGMDVMGTHPCPTTNTGGGNGKEKPIFARGFLNRPSATQLKSTKKKIVHAIQMDSSSSENGMPKFQDFLHNKDICNGTETLCKIVAGNGASDSVPVSTFINKPELGQSGTQGVDWGNVAAISTQHGGENAMGNSSTSSQKELLGSGRKRSLSSEFLHTEQGGSASLKTNGNVISAKQKQVRNGSCHCGSQRKWKKCCGRAGVLGHM